jgi:hypothetical protein
VFVSKQYSEIHNQLTPSLLYMGINFNVQHSFNCVNIVPMVSFSCLSVLSWHDHMKVISHISCTNIFNIDIDSDKKHVLDAHETWENKRMTARLLWQEGNRHHSLWCPPAINIARLNLLMKTSYGNVVRYMLFMHDCDYKSFLTLLDFVWL